MRWSLLERPVVCSAGVAKINPGNIDQLQAQLARAQQRPQDLGPQPELNRDLVAPPRRIPGSIALLTVLSGSTFLVAALSSTLAWFVVAIAGLGGPAAVAIAGGVPLLLSGAMLVRHLRQLHVLQYGVAAAALKMSSRSRGSYESSHLTRYTGWDTESVNYSGPAYRSYLRLGVPNGPFCELSIGGMEYKDGIFVFLPDNPARRVIPQRLSVPLRPDEQGHWRPLRSGEGTARMLLQHGQADTASDVLGADPRIFGWIKGLFCLAALLGQLALLALGIVALL